jgi:hypothetical protein
MSSNLTLSPDGGTYSLEASLKKGGRVCDTAFHANLALVAVMMFSHFIYFKSTVNVIILYFKRDLERKYCNKL